VIRQLVPRLLMPLCVVAGILAGAPWLTAFPAGILAAPLIGAAVLSVLVPAVSARFLRRRLWLSALVDLGCLFVFTMLVVLHSPTGFTDLVDGLYHGPSQLLTFALPLVSPRSLMVAPVVVTWLAGALAAECMARRWFTVLPYGGFLVTFGLAYAGTVRAAGPDASSIHLRETLLAGGLLLTLLLLRVAQAWVREDEEAESTQADGVMPLRGLVIGLVTTVVVTLVAGLIVQSETFPKRAVTPQRVPSVDDSRPLSPVAFTGSVRPRDPKDPGRRVFTVQTDHDTLGYFSIANVDYYDGAGWSFQRTFRPSGGVLPDDPDRALRPNGPTVTQEFHITDGPLTETPWMPYVYRAQKVTGIAVNIDPASGMVVPTQALRVGDQYRVTSGAASVTFDEVPATAVADTTTATTDIQLPGPLRASLDRLVTAFSDETNTPSVPAIPFLLALQQDLRSNYSLTGSEVGAPTSGAVPSASPASSAASSGAASASAERGSSTSFADVVASIAGTGHTGTPEQYATLVALVARELGVPARVVSGFRVRPSGTDKTLPAGSYAVSTAQAWTWVEIPVVGSGWVVLDAAPGQYSAARQQTQAAASPSQLPSVTPSQNALVTKSANGHAVAPKSDVLLDHSSTTRAILILVLIALGALAAALLVILLLRKRVRVLRRRRSPDPRRRVLGAWQESLDVLAEAGLPDLTTLTNSEVAHEAGQRFGSATASHTAYLARAANTVVYSPSTLTTTQDADVAWLTHRDLRRTLRGQLRLPERMAAGLRYHRVKHPRTPVGPASWAEVALAATRSQRGKHPDARRGRRRGSHRRH
jgi:hypothetical protein